MIRHRVALGVVLLVAAAAVGRLVAAGDGPGFDHWKHRNLFPSCQSCHAGVASAGRSVWPAPETCARCHDNQIERRVSWTPPANYPSNLTFTHPEHALEVIRKYGRDSALACVTCHTGINAPRMQVQRAVVRKCLDCHGLPEPHLAVSDTACATCHTPLARAVALTSERIAAFPVPESHRDPAFLFRGHGRAAKAGGPRLAVAASCATCHARDFCLQCHVDAPEQRPIQALQPDPRSLMHRAELRAPPDHETGDFILRHGRRVSNTAKECRTCHTQESCLECHMNAPRGAGLLAPAGEGRAKGALVARRRPPTHVADFRVNHASAASAAPRSCTTCHTTTQCMDCHRPTAASTSGYHPRGFLVRHPAAAYNRETSCADCHSTTQFCAACHQQAGLVAQRTLRPGFHDGKQFFLAGHGQAARQSLETCVGCHAERDCLTCHSAQGGRRFNPHGPGFDPARLKRKNPEMCTTCHGVSIP